MHWNGKSASYYHCLPFISRFFKKFNLKWIGCGLKRQTEKAERTGGRSCLLTPQLLQHLGSVVDEAF